MVYCISELYISGLEDKFRYEVFGLKTEAFNNLRAEIMPNWLLDKTLFIPYLIWSCSFDGTRGLSVMICIDLESSCRE